MTRKLSGKLKTWAVAYLMIAPVTLGLFIFYLWPFVQNIWFSFNDVNKFNMTSFVGLENYKQLLTDKTVWQSLYNSLRYVLIVVPVGLFLSTALAALLNTKIKGQGLYRILYFLPSVTMSAAVAMIWKWMFNERMGILNAILQALGLEGHNWLTNADTALYCIAVVGIWMGVGYNMVILLAGMQNISKTDYEGMQIDGAGKIRMFFSLTLPLLSPTIFFVTITSFIGSFQVFDVIYMMIGPQNPAFADTQSVVMLYYQTAFEYGYKGYAAAISVLIFFVILIVTIIQMILQKKWVTYA